MTSFQPNSIVRSTRTLRRKMHQSKNYRRRLTRCVSLSFSLSSLRTRHQREAITKLRPYWRVTSRGKPEGLTSQNCKVLRIRSWKEARRARRPFGSLRTCRVTAQKLLNKRFALTYATKLAVLRIPTYLYVRVNTHTHMYTLIHTTHTRAHKRVHVCTHTHTRLHTYERNRGGILVQTSRTQLSWICWSTVVQPCRPPCFKPGQSRLGYIVSGKGWPNGDGNAGPSKSVFI